MQMLSMLLSFLAGRPPNPHLGILWLNSEFIYRYGAAKTLCSFAKDGPNVKVHSDVEEVILSFKEAKKPIGMCCIAPVLAAKVLPGCEVTIGTDAGTSEAIKQMVSPSLSPTLLPSFGSSVFPHLLWWGIKLTLIVKGLYKHP